MEKFSKPLKLLKHGTSQGISVSEGLSTPTGSASLKRNFSILAGSLGPQF
jgi:hypothetical protein